MPLSNARVVMQGQSPHPHEHEALKFLRAQLPDNDAYALWAFVELRAPDGRLYEIDALVLTRHCLFVIEFKNWRGKIRAAEDGVDLVQVLPGGKERIHRNPFDLVNHKAKVLASMLDRSKLGRRRPHVQPLVFLAEEGGQVELRGPASAGIVGRPKLAEAVTRAQFYGAPAWLSERTLEVPPREIVAELRALGLSQSRGALNVGDLQVGDVLEDGPGYQDRLAQHPVVESHQRRVRLYLVPQAATDQQRDQLRRAAEREARILMALGDHRYILKATDILLDGPHGGPVVVFDVFEGGVPLDVFLRRHPDLTLQDRLTLLEQIGQALAYCHEKKVVHRGLHPGAVLVRRGESGALESRLYNFQLAASQGLSGGTVHHTVHTARLAELYRAPELLENPQIEQPTCDVFSLGVLAWHLLVGRPPAQTLAERQALLDRLGSLPLSMASDDLAQGWSCQSEVTDPEARKGFDDVIRAATDAKPINRWDNVSQWIDFVLDVSTRPEQTVPADPDPLTARQGDTLIGGLQVQSVLGTGSTARVLLVKREGREYALKVALDAECEERLAEEVAALQRLGRRSGIVELTETGKFGGRLGFLMTHAGSSLSDYLRSEGPPSLDLAVRWGQDLLQALVVLEEEGVQHRDIKPANLGTGDTAAKDARHLMVFDFSLTGIAADRKTAGTPAYRDPFLMRRPGWDAAADRYAAALTLHEMITGVLPRYGKGEGPAITSEEDITLEAERFEAGIRPALEGFFRCALSRDVAVRHPSADAMLLAWRRCFADSASTGHGDEEVSSEGFDYGRVDGATPIEALPLTVRARNALDRSGVQTVRELLGVSKNRIAFIRGVGVETRRAIQRVIEDLEQARPDLLGASDYEPYRANWRGLDMGVAHIRDLPQEAASALEDSDLGRLGRLARAPRERVAKLLGRFAGATAAVDRALAGGLQALLGEAPDSVEAWVARLLPPGSEKRGENTKRTLRVLLGLDPANGEWIEGDDQSSHAADLLGVSRQAVYAALVKGKDEWAAVPSLGLLRGAVGAALDNLGGAAPLEQVAQALPDQLPHASDAPADPAERHRRCRALVRLCAELGGDVGSLRLHGTTWLVRQPESRAALEALGRRADELAQREPLPAPQDVRDQLAAAVADTSLAAVPLEKLVRMAAWASARAAASARLELYPRGLDAGRALRLCSGALSAATFTLAELRAVVAARYPEAQELPAPPALDALLPHGLKWQAADQCYARENAPGETLSHTRLSSTSHRTRRPAPLPRPAQSETEREHQEFERALQVAIESCSFKVLRVSTSQAEATALALQRLFDLEPLSLEALFLQHLHQLASRYGVDRNALLQADRLGPAGPMWDRLSALAGEAAGLLLSDLASRRGALLLTRPGLLARYQLDALLEGLREMVATTTGLGVLLLVPHRSAVAGLIIDGSPRPLTVPALMRQQQLDVPISWLKHQRVGATAA